MKILNLLEKKRIKNGFYKNFKKLSYHIFAWISTGRCKSRRKHYDSNPREKKGQFKLYIWFENKWVYTSFIDKSDFDLKELKDAYDDLSNAVKKLTKIAANTENDELSSKLSKITTKILQAKYELADDVIEPFEDTLKVETKK